MEPLSILLNPYRPLPLAGVVFSEASVEAGRSVRHHWGRDNRWDILPDRMTELPAGLRPRKRRVNWMRGMSVAAAALMRYFGPPLCWSLFIATTATWWRSHRSRCSGPRRGKTAAGQYACMRLLRVTENAFLNWNTARSTAPWYLRAGLSQNRDDLCWRRCSCTTERGRSRCWRCGGASSGRAAHRLRAAAAGQPTA